MKWRQFIFTPLFWRHLLLAAGLSVVLFWISLQIISVYTHHGERIALPDLVGLSAEEAADSAATYGFEITVMDSVYDPNQPQGAILIQDPLPATFVKEGRKVYVTVAGSTPEKVKMPNLLDLSVRQAVEKIMMAGLQVDYLQMIPGEFNNAVVGQLYRGNPIRAGREIDRNSKIVLMVEQAPETGPSVVPDVKGLDAQEAYRLIHSASLNVGKVVFDDGFDEFKSKVSRQYPRAGESLTSGREVDLWFKNE